MRQRVIDIVLACLGLTLLCPLIVLVFICSWLDTRSPLFFQKRVGRNQKPFLLLKFRTMQRGTPSVATHFVDPSNVSTCGRFLRMSKLDELPQLINVIKGDMSIVGPRPGLESQIELTKARQRYGVFSSLPGITGLAQINGIDMSDPEELAKIDAKMLHSMSIKNYFKYIILTAYGRGAGDRLKRSSSL